MIAENTPVKCWKCNHLFPHNETVQGSGHGYSRICLGCNANKDRGYRENPTPEAQKARWIGMRLNAISRHSLEKHESRLTPGEKAFCRGVLLGIWEGRIVCAITAQRDVVAGGTARLSLDCVDPEKRYVPENVSVITVELNSKKWTFTREEVGKRVSAYARSLGYARQGGSPEEVEELEKELAIWRSIESYIVNWERNPQILVIENLTPLFMMDNAAPPRRLTTLSGQEGFDCTSPSPIMTP